MTEPKKEDHRLGDDGNDGQLPKPQIKTGGGGDEDDGPYWNREEAGPSHPAPSYGSFGPHN